MALYTIFKTILMLLALSISFTLFFKKVRKLYRILNSVTGKSEFVLDRVGKRLLLLLTDILGQSNVRRKLVPGLAHTMIFFGFLAVQPHSIELMIRGVIPVFEIGHVMPTVYGGYLFIADLLACLVLVGFAITLYRRLVIRPNYLTLGRDANLIIMFTSMIIVTFLLVNAFQIVMPAVSDRFDYEAVLPVSGWLAGILGLRELSPLGIMIGYELFYYIHIATILGFLIYIPGSKHLHLLAAVPNVFLKRLDREKAIIKTDIEDDEADTFGLGNVGELSWKSVLNLYACTECGRCEELCPAAETGKPLSPKKLVHDLKVDLIQQGDLILAGKVGEVEPLVRESGPVTSDVIWSCTSCRSCEDICPVNIEHMDVMFEIRKHQVLMESDFPPEMQETFNNLENQSNPWGFASDSRADWCKGEDVPLMTDNPEAELLYFVGCSGSFDDRGKKISLAMTRVLKKAGINFAILGPEEGCNGDLARRAGNEYLAQMMIQTNVDLLNQYKPKKILAGCPHCSIC
jgi:heterodisulfide reductase subunit C